MPETCCFCVWNGFGDSGSAMYTRPGTPRLKRTKSRETRRLVKLPWRDYELFEGPLSEAIISMAANYPNQQTPNLWWPKDHTWCVASEIDLPWTYVGGSTGLITRLLDDTRLEAVVTEPDDPIWIDVKDWLTDLIEQAAGGVLSSGSARLDLAAGTVTIQWEPHGRRGKGVVVTRSERSGGWSGGNGPIDTRDPDERKRLVESRIHQAVLSLVEV